MLLGWVVVFLVLAVVAGFFGFSGVAQDSASIAKVLFGLFLILFALSLILLR